ncbi:uncharacterized protein LOC132706830 isoform X2 [Cylas formicarius]|uniref:uncharacterized protein LOC132706830 isoform X2 n=1 Tax=Cylas formicarius TaxID=197179 RepID=UPI0029584F5E|nr:uncharacterized protein LOC132706830 isoform X2 [Cylas formicarius]
MSQNPQKALQKMCKSPKNPSFQIKQEKIDYENLSTNCTVVGSNNLNLVKKPQIVTGMSPAYSNPSPNYPPSPYSSPASLKSPSPSLKPPTPQPNFPVMQIIHNNLIGRQIQTSQPQNIIKLKPHLNILPKPSASPQQSPKPSVSPQIVIPANQPAAATLMPAAQPLLLNQMPMLTAPGVQFILRPQTATQMTAPKIQATAGATAQMPTATAQGLILQPAGAGQQLLQLQPPRSQPMVRVLTNGVHLAPSTTYVTTQMANQQPINASQIHQTIVNNAQQHQHHHQQQQQQQIHLQQQIQQVSVKKKPKAKVKKKLDLANIMKLSGIGDEDDIQFESDTSQSESEHNSVSTTPQPQPQPGLVQTSNIQAQTNFVHTDSKKNIQNIQISAMAQPTLSAATPVVQVLNQNFQSGMISNSTSQAAAAQGIPFNSFIAPNFTINNGLMLQRATGGFKLTVGEDGRLVLQHDPTLNTQDLQNQLILQSLLGLNGGLVLQPSMDQQTVQQTVQTIQQQSVQTIQQQTVQSQTIQTVQQQTVQPQVQHTIQPQIQQQTVQQTIQHQTVNALQQPMQIVQPQPIHSIHSQVQPMHSISQSQVHSLQSQIQSLLQQQQQQAAQQAAHQPQNVHSQAIQSVQNVTQNMAQSSVQNVMAQTMAQSPVQVAQNMTQNSVMAQQNMAQSPVHNVQGFQQAHTQTTQPVLKVQPFQKSQPPVQTVQPIQHHAQQQNVGGDGQPNQQSNAAPPTSYVVNLTPDQLEQLKRNGQLTVNGQTIFMQRPNKDQGEKKLSPKAKPIKKVQKIQGVKTLLQDGGDGVVTTDQTKCAQNNKQSIVSAMASPPPPPKHILPHNHVQPIQSKPAQPQAMVQPSVQHQVKQERQKSPISPAKQQKVSPTVHGHDSNGSNTNHDVDKLLGQILEESNTVTPASGLERPQPQQRITTIQLTPQKQQHLKTIQMQIQSLSARLQPGDTEMQNTLKVLFAEQQKILASGKLLPPDKVYYHNNQLTIVNPSSLNLPSPGHVKSEPPSPVLSSSQSIVRSTSVETVPTSTQQPISTQSHTTPRVSVSVATCTGDLPVQTTVHHHPVHHQVHHHHANNHQAPPHTHPNHLAQRLSVASQLPNIYAKPQAQSPQTPQAQLQSPQPPPQPSQQHHHQQQQQQHQQLHQHHLHRQQQQQQHQQQFLSLTKKAHLIETQLNLDQNGAAKPDVHTPFRDKKDACIRLIRYHCMDQAVLSQKDLAKADEIFEVTAKHLIGKFGKMVDKYKYLLLKESMRQVQTSELMMLDRMFLADEQQSLIKLRQDYENDLVSLQVADHQSLQAQHSGDPNQSTEEYDEWACIQRELGCLPDRDDPKQPSAPSTAQHHVPQSNLKRTSSSDSRLETLKRFRVDKHVKKSDCGVNSVQYGGSGAGSGGGGGSIAARCGYDSSQTNSANSSYGSSREEETETNSIDEQVQSAINSILNLQQNTNMQQNAALDLDSILS